ncbi:MAG: (Fe-S)-binding protein [Verrucomicrobiales bacterium]
MRVTLFIPCFIEAIYPRVAAAMVRVLERLGHTTDVARGQTCCGQPPFNAGFWPEARAVARRQIRLFKDAEVVVIPSGSCGAMVKNFYLELFRGQPEADEVRRLAAKTWEFSEFIFTFLGVREVGASFPGRVTFHDGCHSLRELGTKQAPRELLRAVRGLELVEMKEAETCCGFGGTFAIKFPQISTAMAEVKGQSVIETNADYVISTDSSCLMQIEGWLERHSRREIRCLHLAEVLAHQ